MRKARRSSDRHFSRVVNRSAVPLSRTAELYLPACLRRRRRGSCLALTTSTMLTIALSHLLGRGLRLETHEAVALARELLAHPCGIPTPENIQLGSDGSASCISTDGMPSVSSVADLLMTLLPEWYPQRACAASLCDRARARNGRSAALRVAGRVLERAGAVRKGSEPRRAERRPAARRAPIASDRGAVRRGAGAGHAACGKAFASGAAAHRRSAAADTRGPQTGSVLERADPADRCRAADVQVLRRRRSSGLACTRIAAVGTGGRGGTRRVVCGGLRRRDDQSTGVPRQSHPAPRARRPGSRPPHLQRTIRLRTRRK